MKAFSTTNDNFNNENPNPQMRNSVNVGSENALIGESALKFSFFAGEITDIIIPLIYSLIFNPKLIINKG